MHLFIATCRLHRGFEAASGEVPAFEPRETDLPRGDARRELKGGDGTPEWEREIERLQRGAERENVAGARIPPPGVFDGSFVERGMFLVWGGGGEFVCVCVRVRVIVCKYE